MKKILFFSQSGVGGAERITASISDALDRTRFEAVFYLLEGVKTANDLSDFIPHDYRIERIKHTNPLGVTWQFYKTMRKECPDVVFCSAQHLNRKLLFLSPFFPRCKFVVRNANYLYTHTPVQKLMMALSYPLADIIITQTEEMREELIKGLRLKKKQRVMVLHNPVDTRMIDEKMKCGSVIKSNPASIRYIAVGRFAPEKGFDLLITAFNLVQQRQPNAMLYILGNIKGNSTGYYTIVKENVNRLGLQDKVVFTGYTDNPYSYEKNCNCFVLSSRNEGLPNVLIEALYIGLPAAAFKCIPIIERIVEEGKTGYLAEKENPASLAEAMIKASALGRIKTTYKGASFEDFTRLFDL